jgi:hypothetical protein
LDPVTEEPGGGEKLAEENKLAQRCDRGVRIPLDMKPATVSIDGQRWGEHGAGGGGARIQHLTLRVSRQRSNLQWHEPFQQPLASKGNSSNCFLEAEATNE